MFAIISKIRRKAYLSGFFKSTSVSAKVISVGNLSIGGSGKTPFVIYLAKLLRDVQVPLVVVGKAYKSKIKETTIISNGANIESGAEYISDELLLLAKNLNVPIIATQKKYKGALFAEEKFNPRVIIIDDAFQHLKLKRDLDIVLLDRQTILYPITLPFGRLREPVSTLRFADVVAVPSNVELPQKIKNAIKDKFIIKYKKEQETYLISLKGENIAIDDDLKKQKFIVVSAIANNRNFYEDIESKGFAISDFFAYIDHYNYKFSDVKNIVKTCKRFNSNNIITTEKDFVKLEKFGNYFLENGINLYYIRVNIKIVEGEEIFKEMIFDLIKKEDSE